MVAPTWNPSESVATGTDSARCAVLHAVCRKEKKFVRNHVGKRRCIASGSLPFEQRSSRDSLPKKLIRCLHVKQSVKLFVAFLLEFFSKANHSGALITPVGASERLKRSISYQCVKFTR